MTLAAFKALMREQFLILLIDEQAALQAIPALLPDDHELRRRGLAALKEVLTVRGDLSGAMEDRWHEVVDLFGIEEPAVAAKAPAPAKVVKIAPARQNKG